MSSFLQVFSLFYHLVRRKATRFPRKHVTSHLWSVAAAVTAAEAAAAKNRSVAADGPDYDDNEDDPAKIHSGTGTVVVAHRVTHG